MFVLEKRLLLFMSFNNSILLSAPNVPHGHGVRGRVSDDGSLKHMRVFVELSWVVSQSWRVGELFLTFVLQLGNIYNTIAQEHGFQRHFDTLSLFLSPLPKSPAH
jgi:hypothetical protein